MIRRIGEVNETQNIRRIERDSKRVKASITETSGSKKPKKSYLKLIGLLLLIPTTIGIMFPISLILIGIILVMIIVDFFKQR